MSVGLTRAQKDNYLDKGQFLALVFAPHQKSPEVLFELLKLLQNGQVFRLEILEISYGPEQVPLHLHVLHLHVERVGLSSWGKGRDGQVLGHGVRGQHRRLQGPHNVSHGHQVLQRAA